MTSQPYQQIILWVRLLQARNQLMNSLVFLTNLTIPPPPTPQHLVPNWYTCETCSSRWNVESQQILETVSFKSFIASWLYVSVFQCYTGCPPSPDKTSLLNKEAVFVSFYSTQSLCDQNCTLVTKHKICSHSSRPFSQVFKFLTVNSSCQQNTAIMQFQFCNIYYSVSSLINMHNIKITHSLDCSALKSSHTLLQSTVPLYYSPLCGCDEVTKHFLAYWSLTCLILWLSSILTVCHNCDSKGEITALFKCFPNQFLYTKSISPIKVSFLYFTSGTPQFVWDTIFSQI